MLLPDDNKCCGTVFIKKKKKKKKSRKLKENFNIADSSVYVYTINNSKMMSGGWARSYVLGKKFLRRKRNAGKKNPVGTVCVFLWVWVFPGALGHALVSVPPRDGAHAQQEEGACVGGACKLLGCLLLGGRAGVPWETRKPKGAQQMKRSDERWTS